MQAIQVVAVVLPAEKMVALITEIARALVDYPDEVVVKSLQGRDGVTIRLQVAHQDIGKVIGKQGRTARSLRAILRAASMKLHHRFSLDIAEEGRELRARTQIHVEPEVDSGSSACADFEAAI